MKITWNDETVTGPVLDVIVRDNAGGCADTLAILFTDPELMWLNWQPQKGDIITVSDGGWSSGAMFFDGFGAKDGIFQALAISTPPAGRTEAHRAWQDALFSHIAGDISNACGLALELHDVPDYRYASVAQGGAANLWFLHTLCAREGWMLKVHDVRAFVFDEKTMESQPKAMTLSRADLGKEYEFGTASADLKSRCRVRHYGQGGLVDYTYDAPGIYGGSIEFDGCAASLGEAQRFARAALRAANKGEFYGRFSLPMNRAIAAGNTFELTGMGTLSGIWYLTMVEQRMVTGRTLCRCRRPIQGGY